MTRWKRFGQGCVLIGTASRLLCGYRWLRHALLRPLENRYPTILQSTNRGFACAVERPTSSVETQSHPAITASADSNRSDGVWQRSCRSLRCKRSPLGEISKRAGRNADEHPANLETGDADADPVRKRGKLSGRATKLNESFSLHHLGWSLPEQPPPHIYVNQLTPGCVDNLGAS